MLASSAAVSMVLLAGANPPLEAAAAPSTHSAPHTLARANASTPSVPILSGPLPTNAGSYPFNAADHNLTSVDLAGHGYVENEYTLSGTANVYAWMGTSLSVGVTASGPYTTRMLVRAPSNPSRFSGTVIVELLNPSYGYDLDYLWAADHDYFMSHDGTGKGDAWVGVTVNPSSIAALQRFDPARYRSLSMANPASLPPDCNVPAGMSPTAEPGLEWDIVSQLGTLLKSNSSASPLAGLDVREAYATGYSTGANNLVTYVNAFEPIESLPNGEPIYDGYLIGAAAGVPTTLSLCAPWFAPGDPHDVIQPHREPVIRVNTQSDFGQWFGAAGVTPLGNTLNRRADHDAAGDQFRLYEVPGASHLWLYPYQYFPNASELGRIGASVATDGCPDQPGNSFPLQYILDGAFANIDDWARSGALPPRADRISVNNAGTYSETTVLDGWGNARGGLRTPYVDEPIDAYVPFSNGTGCGVWGHEVPSPAPVIAHTYPGDYVEQVTASVGKLSEYGWVTRTDAQKIIDEASAANVP